MTVQIDGMRCIALVDTGCTQTVICKACCQAWERKEVHVLTVDGNTLRCCGVRVVWLGISNRPSVDIETLVVDKELLGFDLLLGLDAIKQLAGMSMTSTGEVKLPQCHKPICTAITINELDFQAKFDTNRWIWIAS